VKRFGWIALVGLATMGGVFLLPWVVPVSVRPVDSFSQAIGFSNRVSAISAVIGALLLAVIAYLTRKAAAEPFVSVEPVAESERLGWPVVAGVAAALAAVVLGVGGLLGGRPVLDSIYLVDRMLYVVNGSRPYSQFEFSYGPLLLYPQVWLFEGLRFLGASANWVYCGWLAVAQALGALLAGYVVDRLGLASRGARIGLFVAVAGVAAPLLSLNDSLFRFVWPYALLLFVLGIAHRRGFGAGVAMLALLGVVVAAAVSPEQGIALLAGFATAFAVAAWAKAPGARPGLGVLLVGGGVSAVVVLRLPMFAWTAAGVNNLPVLLATAPLVLVGAVLVASVATGRQFDLAAADRAPVLAGWFAMGLVLLSAAFGRADGVHEFLNGLGPLLAAAAVLSRSRYWAAGVAVCALGFALVSYGWSGQAVRTVASGAPPDARAQAGALGSLSRVAVAGPLSDALGEQLALRHALVPTYGWHMYDAQEVAVVLGQVSSAEYLLVPQDRYAAYVNVEPASAGFRLLAARPGHENVWQRVVHAFGVSAPAIHPSLDPAGSLFPALLRGFVPVKRVGVWVLMRRRGAS
jgi:hypothetical protein